MVSNDPSLGVNAFHLYSLCANEERCAFRNLPTRRTGLGKLRPPYFGGPGKIFEIMHANLYILMLFGVVYLGQQSRVTIFEGRKDTLTPVFFIGVIAPSSSASRDRHL